MDEKGKLSPEHWRFILHLLMMDYTNFKEEKSTMVLLLDDLNTKSHNNQKIKLLVSPSTTASLRVKEWSMLGGIMKQYFQSLSLEKKKKKQSLTMLSEKLWDM